MRFIDIIMLSETDVPNHRASLCVQAAVRHHNRIAPRTRRAIHPLTNAGEAACAHSHVQNPIVGRPGSRPRLDQSAPGFLIRSWPSMMDLRIKQTLFSGWTRMDAVISQTAEHALRAIVCLAANPGQRLTAEKIARATRVPAPHLSFILTCLRRAGLLRAQRGRSGGCQLARPPSAITVLDIVQVFQSLRSKSPWRGAKAPGDPLGRLQERIDAGRRMAGKVLGACKISRLIDSNRPCALLSS